MTAKQSLWWARLGILACALSLSLLSGCSLPTVDGGGETGSPATAQNHTSGKTVTVGFRRNPNVTLWSAAQLEEGISTHEAGHTTVAFALGVGVEYLKYTNFGGETQHDDASADNQAMIALGGLWAEKDLLGFDLQGSGPDMNAVAQLVGEQRKQQLVPQVRAIISKHQNAIRAIADEMKRTRYVSGRRAAQLFNQAEGGQSNPLPGPAASGPTPLPSPTTPQPAPPATGGGWNGAQADCESRGGTYNAKERSCHYRDGNSNTPQMHDDSEDPSGWTMQCSHCRPNDPVMEAHRAQGGKIAGAYARYGRRNQR